jgi:ethanolamine utilization cobalamin adenosyltransferase
VSEKNGEIKKRNYIKNKIMNIKIKDEIEKSSTRDNNNKMESNNNLFSKRFCSFAAICSAIN